jgi:hypothetical protein
MSKNESWAKIEVTDGPEPVLRMEITLEDLVLLFHGDPENPCRIDAGGEEILLASVKPGKLFEFGNLVAELLTEYADRSHDGTPRWMLGFDEVFEKICEGTYDEVIDYADDE